MQSQDKPRSQFAKGDVVVVGGLPVPAQVVVANDGTDRAIVRWDMGEGKPRKYRTCRASELTLIERPEPDARAVPKV